MSFNYNHVVLLGRLTKDPDQKIMADGRSKVCFRLAVNRSYKKDSGVVNTDFVPIVLFGKLADLAYQLLKKALPVLISGKLQIRQYQKEGDVLWMTEVVADNFQLLQSMEKKPCSVDEMVNV